jgi:acetyltransferase-like isoleucine patch superfamily enzyme
MQHYKHYINLKNNSYIHADEIIIGKDFSVGNNVHIDVRGTFKIGNYSRFGDDVTIKAESVDIGDHFFHYTPGLLIGGGGSQFPEAILKIGNRCVLHNNYFNLCCPITLGNDVGMSPDSDIITHGFWNSVLEGYPTKYDGVVLGDGVIIGQRTLILMGVTISKNIVVGANSTVSKSLLSNKSIYAGNPAKFIKPILEPSYEHKLKIFDDIIARYKFLVKENYISLKYKYPIVLLNDAIINVETKEIVGTQDETTDKFRDHIRRYGIKIYTERPFLGL